MKFLAGRKFLNILPIFCYSAMKSGSLSRDVLSFLFLVGGMAVYSAILINKRDWCMLTNGDVASLGIRKISQV